MGEISEEDLDILPRYSGWDSEDLENKNGSSDPWEDLDADEDEHSKTPETVPVCMPSSLKRDDI
jgi:hypothetical protein